MYRCGQNRIDCGQHRFNRTHRSTKIQSDSGCGGSVVASRRENIQMMPHGILQPREGSVVEECRLKGHIPDRRRAELVPVLYITGDLLQTEVLVCERPIKWNIAHYGSNLWNPDNVRCKVAEHFVGLA